MPYHFQPQRQHPDPKLLNKRERYAAAPVYGNDDGIQDQRAPQARTRLPLMADDVMDQEGSIRSEQDGRMNECDACEDLEEAHAIDSDEEDGQYAYSTHAVCVLQKPSSTLPSSLWEIAF